jgi:large conductance mechanosensitive channel
MWQEFKKFVNKGNIIDLAIGVIIGGAFGKIVASFVNDIIMPLLSLVTKNIKFENLFIALDGNEYATIEAAKTAGVVTINYGSFITAIIDFLVIAICIFIAVRQLNKIQKKFSKKPEPPPPNVKDCPFCKTSIHKEASRCPNCTSQLEEKEKTEENNDLN